MRQGEANMKKSGINKKILFLLTIVICLFSGLFSTSQYVYAQEFTSLDCIDGYCLSSYDVNIIVNENNTFEITEKIGVFFDIPKHGIFRKIPLKNTVTRLDGTTSYNRVKISEISVSESYKIDREKGYKIINIGNANRTLTGEKDYTIKYTYDIGKDTGKNYDELYFNIIGNDWDTNISNVTFTITMPKEFDEKKIGFSRGSRGSTKSSNILYEVNGKVITGRYNGRLRAEEGITVRLELPEGYFVGANKGIDLVMILALCLPIIFVLISFFMWIKYGRDDQVVETVEFYPPTGLNSAEVGFLYKGKADENDVISLLVYLANKGYIKIMEFEQKGIFSKKKSFKLLKTKDYDGDNEYEKIFLEDLFRSKDEVTAKDLTNSFYLTLEEITKKINSKENKEKVFAGNSLKNGYWVILMSVIVYLLITVKALIEFDEISIALFKSLIPIFGISLFYPMIRYKKSLFLRTLGTILGIVTSGFLWMLMIKPAIEFDSLYLVALLLGFVSILLMAFFYKIMSQRTQYGNEMLGKIKGFKSFLEAAEKSRLEALVMEKPSYFFDILPYTYVLGVSDKWIDKFETIAVQAPNWYDANNAFNMVGFHIFMHSTMNSVTDAMSSTPPSSTSTGGGFSGGGSGGGGGGSW